ncbi:MAG: Uma2 family endonuclease [Okeania sp. SIO2G4]|uniref:Uma2 family endonuclease n=1 Tax=unclassified Okeania TaxID=2634635 RepID=UPI0013BDA2A5|nr:MULTISPECIES: Uma2 family endonuclease [unclassified Okeania]NEP70739.1 Uma2 family endonuclease [Okeania sp. SIO2G5]NEP93438.1 Uma2 family endonuclease [Okeania sp. SIO2F5]NEQ92707.1 Uma2 family endonuclease [Okeania sp. SIO2G4]
MIANQNQFYVSPEDYLAGERQSPIKHEYRQGKIYAMVGAKKPHVIIASNLVTELNIHLRDHDCIVLTSDIKVRLEEANCYYYPDVAVTCDERDLSLTEDFIRYPSLIIEILSPSTAKFDRGGKFVDYQTATSLQEYVLVSQSQMNIECFRKNEQGIWISHTYNRGEKVNFASVHFNCQIELIYRKVPGIEFING